MAKVAPSILSANFNNLIEEIKQEEYKNKVKISIDINPNNMI